MKPCFGYIRVSTAKQGEHGVSLQEQKDAILRFAERNALKIESWFEERETAAKRGRPVFNEMLKQLKRGIAGAIVIHKIDRSARNLRDWADLGELIDKGVDVHFVNESLDLHSRGGRLSADIQAVVAADYIRNLREETRKGFFGRLKQGLYPLPAPLGYLDQGKGKPKIPDPAKANLVRKTFEFYATGRFSLDTLSDTVFTLGLRNRNGGRVSVDGLSTMLNNTFYIGLIRLHDGECFPGKHEPIVKSSVFHRVQKVLQGKAQVRQCHHDFTFRRLLKCALCSYSLTGSRKKGHVYYRCHTRTCPMKCIREEVVECHIDQQLHPFEFTEADREYLKWRIYEMRKEWIERHEDLIRSMNLSLRALEDRLNRLTDAYLDQVVDKETFERRKANLLLEKNVLEENLAEMRNNPQSLADALLEFFELAGSLYSRYILAECEEKRDLIKNVTSNCLVEGKNVSMKLKFPFYEVAEHLKMTNGGP